MSLDYFKRQLVKLLENWDKPIVTSSTITATGGVELGSTIAVDTINEYTTDAGVTVDGVVIKDNDIPTVVDVTASGTVQAEQLTSTDDITLTSAGSLINTDSSDGYDTYTLSMTPASAANSSRGAYLSLAGNEAASTAGRASLIGGDVGTGTNVYLLTPGNQSIQLATNSVTRFAIDGSGDVTGSVFGAWTTAAVTSLTANGTSWVGTPTQSASRWKKIGKLIFWQLSITGAKPTANTGLIYFTVPSGYTAYTTDHSIKSVGRGTTNSSIGLHVIHNSSSTVFSIYRADGTNFTGGVSYSLWVGGSYEAA